MLLPYREIETDGTEKATSRTGAESQACDLSRPLAFIPARIMAAGKLIESREPLLALTATKNTLLVVHPLLVQGSLTSCASGPGSGVVLTSTGRGLLEGGGPPPLGGGGAPFTFALGAKSSSLLFASPSLNISSNALFPLATFGFRAVLPGTLLGEVCGCALGGGKSIAAGTKKSPTGLAGDAVR